MSDHHQGIRGWRLSMLATAAVLGWVLLIVWHRHGDPAHRGASPGFETPRHTHDSVRAPELER